MSVASAAVVVPMYNEAEAVGPVLSELRRTFATVVCIDDGSADGSAAIARRNGATVISHCVNLGQGAALRTGFEFVLGHTDATHVVTFDADGQHSVSDALSMLTMALDSGVDVVLGSRSTGATTGQPLRRRLLLQAGLRFSRWDTGLPLTDTHNGLRVLSRATVASMLLRQPGMAYASELERRVADLGLSWCEHPTSVTYSAYSRKKGQSNLNALNILFDLYSARLQGPS